jgi:membrane associated rhomboid family serine protease
VSYLGFRSEVFEQKCIFQPEAILAWKQPYRLVTSAFLHANWTHLMLNMVSLYLFGSVVELALGQSHFLLVYFGAVLSGNLLALYVHRHHDYRACGASGGVCGIIFAYILLFPGAEIQMFLLPFYVPGWLYAIGFMLGSFYGMKTQRDNIGHDAHLGGAIVGLLLAAALNPWTVRLNPGVFFSVLGGAVLLMTYLWRNPLWLSLTNLFTPTLQRRQKAPNQPAHRKKAMDTDIILGKIAAGGMESLTEEEKSFLEHVSGKYRRREESKKPESGLAI